LSQKVLGDPTKYSIVLDKDNTPNEISSESYSSATQKIKTVDFDYTESKKTNDVHVVLGPEGSICNNFDTQITSILSIEIIFDGTSPTLSTGVSSYDMSVNEPLVSGEAIEFIDTPYFFSLVNNGLFDIDISQIIIEYSCVATYATINYQTNGGSDITPLVASIGSSISEPTSPTKEGYSFAGWFSDPELTIPYVFDTMPEYNLTLYADWTINEYQITFIELGFDEVKQLSSGDSFAIAVTETGHVFTWGYNGYGGLGDGTEQYKKLPNEITSNFQLEEDDQVIYVAAGNNYSLAITDTGRVFSWGDNAFEKLGNNSTTRQHIPNEITERFELETEDQIVYIDGSSSHSMALSTTGRVFTWGRNEYGQLGDDSKSDRHVPTEITEQFPLIGDDQVILINSSGAHTIALTENGRVFAFGRNTYKQIGDGSTTHRQIPTEVLSSRFNLDEADKIIFVDAGASHSMALSSYGRVFAWGNNGQGQIGWGLGYSPNLPEEITSKFSLEETDKISQICAGGEYNLAMSEAGKTFGWGANANGRIGIGNTTNYNVPVETTNNLIDEATGQIIHLNAGTEFAQAITDLGKTLAWGNNTYGQLGNNTQTSSVTPINNTDNFVAEMNIFKQMLEYGTNIEYQPNKEGYDFSGWYHEKELITLYDPLLMPAIELILYGTFYIK
jgi:uncharacterized repeat protein (TIGR02543 family)